MPVYPGAPRPISFPSALLVVAVAHCRDRPLR